MHVFADLRPYICTFENCQEHLSQFSSRSVWADHEFSKHRQHTEWECLICKQTYSDIEVCKTHLKEAHEIERNELADPLAKLIASTARARPIEQEECFLCRQKPATTKRSFLKHVGRHMEEIALMALPVTDSNENDSVDTEESCVSNHTAEKSHPSTSLASPPLSLLGQVQNANKLLLKAGIDRGNLSNALFESFLLSPPSAQLKAIERYAESRCKDALKRASAHTEGEIRLGARNSRLPLPSGRLSNENPLSEEKWSPFFMVPSDTNVAIGTNFFDPSEHIPLPSERLSIENPLSEEEWLPLDCWWRLNTDAAIGIKFPDPSEHILLPSERLSNENSHSEEEWFSLPTEPSNTDAAIGTKFPDPSENMPLSSQGVIMSQAYIDEEVPEKAVIEGLYPRKGKKKLPASQSSYHSSGDVTNLDPAILAPPKRPQCWDHDCNGRMFSTFSNLLRHQREKSGTASKPTCPNCGAEFTRKSALDGHIAHKCGITIQ